MGDIIEKDASRSSTKAMSCSSIAPMRALVFPSWVGRLATIHVDKAGDWVLLTQLHAWMNLRNIFGMSNKQPSLTRYTHNTLVLFSLLLLHPSSFIPLLSPPLPFLSSPSSPALNHCSSVFLPRIERYLIPPPASSVISCLLPSP